MNLSEINWGDDSAEKDSLLSEYFVESVSFKRITNGSKKIIVGRKGAGKSALMKMSLDSYKKDNFIVIKVTPSLEVLKSALQTAKSIHGDDKENSLTHIRDVIYTHTWVSYVYEKMLCLLGERINEEPGVKVENLVGSKKFASDMSKDQGIYQKTLAGYMQNIINGLKIEGGKLGKIGISIGENEDIQTKVSELSKINLYSYHIEKLIGSYKIAVLVDDLDQGWDGSEESNSFTKGIIYAIDQINISFPQVKTALFIREDMYAIILSGMQHSDKYRNAERIKWSVDTLKEILVKRIKFNLGADQTSSDPYHDVFPDKVGKTYSEKWIFDRTLFRPRELLQFARMYTESLESNEPNAKKLKTAESQYSQWKLSDLCSEFYEQYPGLNSILEWWRTKFFRHKYHLDYDDAEKVIKDIYAGVDLSHEWFVKLKENHDVTGLMRVLYNIGFLGDYALGGNGGTKIKYSYEADGTPVLSSVQIHPCFRVAMNTVERERNRKQQKV
ncbi:P-loop ATPase, Sll1717 family [Pantoea agglomerans]|uniref:P-loop ATPase, Sll1717 family n=1 Tax=Enterobacter agglomerans TaxID=549 RepID=UPI0032090339